MIETILIGKIIEGKPLKIKTDDNRIKDNLIDKKSKELEDVNPIPYLCIKYANNLERK